MVRNTEWLDDTTLFAAAARDYPGRALVRYYRVGGEGAADAEADAVSDGHM